MFENENAVAVKVKTIQLNLQQHSASLRSVYLTMHLDWIENSFLRVTERTDSEGVGRKGVNATQFHHTVPTLPTANTRAVRDKRYFGTFDLIAS